MTCVGYCFPVATAAAVAAGPAALAATLALGAGVLVAQGLVWYGQKLQENYENACREWTELHEAAWAEQRSRVSDMADAIEAARRRTATPAANLTPSGADSPPPGAPDPRLASLLERARAAGQGGAAGPGPGEDDLQRRARIAIEAADRWVAPGREAVRLRAALLSLDTMGQEMAVLETVPPARLDPLRARIAEATRTMDAALSAGASEPEPALRAVAQEVRGLEEYALRMARRGQQERLAGIVAETMGGLGYRAPGGGDPVVLDGGDVLTVAGLRAGDPGEESGDRLLSVDVSAGGIAYDFSGYAGDASRDDARELFEALRARGVIMLDGGALEGLDALPAWEVTADTLDGMRFVPESGEHKNQARIAEQVLDGMARRGMDGVRHRSAGGTIDIEAFDGPVRYRVSVPPHGRARVLRDDQDVSDDRKDPVVADATLGAAAEEEDTAMDDERQRIDAALRRSLERRRRSALSH